MRDSFIFYRSFQKAIDACSQDDQLLIYKAIANYALDRVEPDLSGVAQVCWVLIMPQLDAHWKRYDNGCKGGEFGKKGGAPKGNKNANKGKTTLTAKAGSCIDESTINKVEKFNEKYRLKEEGALLNWFDITAPEGYFSLNDKIGDIMENPEGMKLFGDLMKQFMGGADGKKKKVMGFEMTPAMMKMLGGFTVLRAMNMAGSANITITKEQLLALNEQLNKIKK